LRRAPIEERKAALAKLLRRPTGSIAFDEHYSGDGAIIYKHACALGCEGIVSKRLGSPYRSGRANCWLKVKNPAAPASRARPRRSGGIENRRFLSGSGALLRCRHEGTLSQADFGRFGLRPDAPIAAFVKHLRCSECGSASVWRGAQVVSRSRIRRAKGIALRRAKGSRNNEAVASLFCVQSHCMATNKPRLRAKAQPASNQDDGTKALERSRETGAYGSKEGWQVQIGASGKSDR
jgi:hypothetical protein